MSIRNNFNQTDTICAISTPSGVGAISMLRISGAQAIEICGKIFQTKKHNDINQLPSNSLIYGQIVFNLEMVDDVLLSVFRNPHSFTGEDLVEINCHGSLYIQKKIIEILLSLGLRLASPGEFTMRAFMNKKLDLSQAEAIGDLIAATSKSAHNLAVNQMRGGFSNKIKELRDKLITFASLIELELDFSDEDVEFANRDDFQKLLSELKQEISLLKESFTQGNVLKNGIPVAIVGKPNVGKSTLLNALLNEEKAIVSEIPGTTRDTIEDLLTIQGITFRFIDTAGLRPSGDQIELMGIERTYQKISQASIVLYVVDITQTDADEIKAEIADFEEHIISNTKKFIIIGNKTDQLIETPHGFPGLVELETIFVSAKRKENIQLITDSLVRSVDISPEMDNIVVSNIRHFEALSKTLMAIESMEKALQDYIPTDLLTTDIRSAMYFLGEITGEITTEDILGSIFSKFCIGK